MSVAVCAIVMSYGNRWRPTTNRGENCLCQYWTVDYFTSRRPGRTEWLSIYAVCRDAIHSDSKVHGSQGHTNVPRIVSAKAALFLPEILFGDFIILERKRVCSKFYDPNRTEYAEMVRKARRGIVFDVRLISHLIVFNNILTTIHPV